MADPNNGDGYSGQQTPTSGDSEFNAQVFLFWSLLARVRTCQVVQVVGVTNTGGNVPAGYVDVMPLVNQMDGARNAEPHATIYHCPYFRLQGGSNAVIIDPAVGDIGMVGFADRDISSVMANQTAAAPWTPGTERKANANPGSARMFDLADAMYFGGFLGAAITQWLRMSASGIEMLSPTQIKLQAPDIQFVGPTHTTGAVTGDSTAVYQGDVTGQGTHLHTHLHSGVMPGGSNTGAPV
jgi:hypothetical protein